jgi:hypothetical protein
MIASNKAMRRNYCVGEPVAVRPGVERPLSGKESATISHQAGLAPNGSTCLEKDYENVPAEKRHWTL